MVPIPSQNVTGLIVAEMTYSKDIFPGCYPGYFASSLNGSGEICHHVSCLSPWWLEGPRELKQTVFVKWSFEGSQQTLVSICFIWIWVSNHVDMTYKICTAHCVLSNMYHLVNYGTQKNIMFPLEFTSSWYKLKPGTVCCTNSVYIFESTTHI